MRRGWFTMLPMRSLQLSEMQLPKMRRSMSALHGESNKRTKTTTTEEEEEYERRMEEVSPSWTPHPRTGIYFPAGHEHVIDDVPSGANSLSQTYWLRSIDGADKPDPDVDYQIYTTRRRY